MKLSKYLTFLFLSIFFINFVTPAFAKPVINLSDKPTLDHAWRKSEIVPLPAQARSFEKDPFSDPFSLPYSSSDNGIWYEPGTNPRVFQEVDVTHYTIDAVFDLGNSPYPDNANLEAEATINAQAKAIPLTELVVDLYDNITIDSLQLNGELLTLSDNYTRSDNKIWITLSDNNTIAPLEDFEIIVNYHRVYGGAFSGVGFKTHGVSNTPVIYSLSQPYIAPMWRPCFDVPSDKATADIYITCPDWMTTTSNGSLQPGYPIDNGDGTITAFWKENYPIYTSVLSLAMTDYTAWSDTYVSPLDNSTMPLNYFAFPEDSAKAMDDFTINKDALEIFAQAFGEYPFINEKYGVAETPNRFGSLENQTMTSLTITATQNSVNWDVIVHELAHQWWGDALTCDTWNHVWLHEGFATYSEIIFYERLTGGPPGPFMALEYDDGLYNGELAATVYCEDANLNNPFTQIGSIYEKGAWVVHMVRHMMGDTSFFSAISAYYQEHIHSTVVTSDFKTAMEYEYGNSLDDFFDQWLYTQYRPVYSVLYENSSRSGGYLVDIHLQQTQGHSVVDISGNILRDYYIMPVDFTVHYKDLTKETFTVNNNQRSQHFQLLTTKEPDYTVFDEDKNILKVVYEETADNDGILNDGDNSSIFGDNTCAGGNTDNCDDNCPDTPNGFDLGTCSKTFSDLIIGTKITCTDNSTCGSGICQMEQQDYNGNGVGDVCECYANLNGDNKVNSSDLLLLKIDYNRSNCSPENPCIADINKNGSVNSQDLLIMKVQYNRNNCPPIP